MIKYYVNSPEGKGLKKVDSIQKDCWIYMEAPVFDEIAEVAAATGIPEVFLNTALDEEEAAHLDMEGTSRLIAIDIPKMSDNLAEPSFYTIPLVLIQNESYFVSVCLKPTSVVKDLIKGKIKNIDLTKRDKLVYQIMYNNFTRFLYYLKRIDKTSDEIQKNLSKSMQNKELLMLFSLQKSLVFFSASLTANNAILQKIIYNNMPKANEVERGILEDVLIESRQAMEMCSVFREIMKSTMDAFASVVNNNQNIVMKFLTAVTIILSIPTLIASFWGMNTGVPFEGKAIGFGIVAGISIAITLVITFIMGRKKMF